MICILLFLPLLYALSPEHIQPFWSHHHLNDLNSQRVPPELIVQTAFGEVQGTFYHPEFKSLDGETKGRPEHSRAFLGIPFARPPLKDLRFEKPVAWNQTWEEAFNRKILKATRFSPQCLNLIPLPAYGLSEDCLYLNIYTPPAARLDKKKLLPVMFWVYGGAFMFGEAGVGRPGDGNNLYIGSFVTYHKDVMIVNFNYRMNSFGFLKIDDDTINIGYHDQLMALNWVKENIRDFGGDPDQITVFGLSSGAYSSMMLAFDTNAPEIQKAILMSSPMSFHPKSSEKSLLLTRQFLKKLKCLKETSSESKKCLKSQNAIQILLADVTSNVGYMETVIGDPLKWMPTVDPVHFPQRPLEALLNPSPALQKRLSKMQIMTGTLENEGSFFVAIFELLNFVPGSSFFFLRGNQTVFQFAKSIFRDLIFKRSLNEPNMLDQLLHAKSLDYDEQALTLQESQLGIDLSLPHHADRQYHLLLQRVFNNETMVEKILEQYPYQHDVKMNVNQFNAILTDYIFTCSTETFLKRLKQTTSAQAFSYFTRHVPHWIEPIFGPPPAYFSYAPVAHASDVSYFFHYFPKVNPKDETISRIYIDYFTAFAMGKQNHTFGDFHTPDALYETLTGQPLPEFKDWQLSRQNYLQWNNEAVEKEKVKQEKCLFWEKLNPDHAFPLSKD